MITRDHIQSFQDEGYVLAERVITQPTVELLRGECERFMYEMDREFEAEGVEQKGLSKRGNRCFVSQWYKRPASTILRDFLFSDLMRDICEATIGNTAYLFHEQFVVKGPEQGIPVLLPAGSVAAFGSLVFHRGGANTSPNMRRVYLPQFSPEPIFRSNGTPWGWMDPFIVDGERQPLPELG